MLDFVLWHRDEGVVFCINERIHKQAIHHSAWRMSCEDNNVLSLALCSFRYCQYSHIYSHRMPTGWPQELGLQLCCYAHEAGIPRQNWSQIQEEARNDCQVTDTLSALPASCKNVVQNSWFLKTAHACNRVPRNSLVNWDLFASVYVINEKNMWWMIIFTASR